MLEFMASSLQRDVLVVEEQGSLQAVMGQCFSLPVECSGKGKCLTMTQNHWLSWTYDYFSIGSVTLYENILQLTALEQRPCTGSSPMERGEAADQAQDRFLVERRDRDATSSGEEGTRQRRRGSS